MKSVKSFVLSLLAVVAMCAMTSCANNSVEGKWKVDDATMKQLMGKDAEKGTTTATVDITADKAVVTLDMSLEESEMSFKMTLEATCSYTKTDTEVTVTPTDVKLVKMELPEVLKKMADSQGMTEEQMKKEFAKEFTDKPKESQKLTYTLEGDKLTLKDKTASIVLVRQK